MPTTSIVDISRPYGEQGSFLELERAAREQRAARDVWRTRAQRRRHGHLLHVHRHGRQRRARARRHRRRRATPARRRSRTCSRPNPNPPEQPEHHYGPPASRGRSSSSTTSRAAHCTSVPRRTSAATSCSGSTTVQRGASSCAGSMPSSMRAATRARSRDAWATVAFTYTGWSGSACRRRRSTASRRSFSRAWRRARPSSATSARATPANWETPLGTPDVHVAISVICAETPTGSKTVAARARQAHAELRGVEVIWRQDCYQLPTGRTSFGFKDGIGQPAIEGSGDRGSNPHEPPIKAGEFLLGYPDETGELPPMPTPEVLGRNGTYIVFRKLHTRVAAYRRYLRANAADRDAGGGCSARRWWAAGRAARRCRSPPTGTTPSSAPIRGATTPSSTATTSRASSARPARMRGARTRGTRSTTTATSTSASTG